MSSSSILRTTLRSSIRSTRLASTTSFPSTPTPTKAARELPKAAPWNSVPFTAPPEDTTQGQLGQVFIPDMERIEHVPEQAIQIPGEPDNYTLRSSTFIPEDIGAPIPRAPPAVFTVTSPSTHPGGAPSHGSSADDVVIPGSVGDSTSRAVPEGQDVSRSGGSGVPFTAAERKGVWTLVGIVVVGFGLGGLLEGGKTEKRVREVVGKVEDKVVEEKRLV